MSEQRLGGDRWLVPVLALMWAWPAAMFLPIVLNLSGLGIHLVSAAITIALGLLLTAACARYVQFLPARVLGGIVIASVAIAVIGVAVYLLLVQAGVMGGLGGDRGDALDVALRRLLDGQYPYSELTSWGGKITPLPGGLVLALPAHVTLHAGFATVYLVPLAAFLLWRLDRVVAAVACLGLVLSPAFWADALSSGDLVVTSFLLFAVALGTVRAARTGGWARWAWPLGLGLIAATRITAVLVVVVVGALVAATVDRRRALEQGAIAVAVVLLLSLPFYAWNPAEFSPLHTSSFVRGPAGMVAVVVLLGITVVAVLRLRFFRVIPAGAALVWALVPLAIALTLVPLVLDPSMATLYISGYAVLALTAPVAVIRQQPLPSEASSAP